MTRAAAADILSEEEDAVGVGKIVEGHGADRDPDAFRQSHRRAFMAHIGAVRQVVGAVEASNS
jgi:hypothetical protein